jgi:hypothetical protein
MKQVQVYCEKHYNRFLKVWDYRLSCDSDKFPINVYADSIEEAKEYCNHFLGLNNWKLEGTN